MNKQTIIKNLIQQAKKYGYLTFDDLNKTFNETQFSKEELDDFITTLTEIGIKIIEISKTKQDILNKEEISQTIEPLETELDEEILPQEPLQIFLEEISKIEPIDRKTEISIAKNIRMNEKKLLSIVLSSPIVLGEINKWKTLLKQNEMTHKELMKRGRKSKRSLQKMKKRFSYVIRQVNKLAKRITKNTKILTKNSLSEKEAAKINKMIEQDKTKIVNYITSLELNAEKIKRLINRTTNMIQKAVQFIEEAKKYENLFSKDYHSVMQLYKQLKKGKLSTVKFRKITGYSPSAAETLLENFSRVVSKLEQFKKEFNMTEEEIIDFHKKINELTSIIHEDKMKLIKANLSMVVTFARKFSMLTGADINDLIQEGTTGLSKAVEKFEWRKGYKFSTYAHWWVRQAIGRYMADFVKTIRLPVHIRALISKLAKVAKKIKNKYDRETTMDDYTKALKIPPKKIYPIIPIIPDPISLDEKIGKDEDASLQDFVSGPEEENPSYYLTLKYKRELLETTMEKVLDKREREILKYRYGFYGKEYTLEEVGKKFNITRERVRQIEAKAIRKLRDPEILEILREIYPVKM